MPRVGLINLALGFALIAWAAMGGFFVATEAHEAFLHDPDQLASWSFTLWRSAHGHTNLFGILHILLGLTLPYARPSVRVARGCTAGLALGSAAMSFLLVARSFVPPESASNFWWDAIIGTALTAALAALVVHATLLAARAWR